VNDGPFRRIQLAMVLAVSTCLFWDTGGAADRPVKPMRESATVPADMNVQKRFGSVDEYLEDKRWTEAIDVLLEIAQSDGKLLVQARPGAFNESAGYLSVATRCNILLAKLPPEGLAAYRKKVDPQARRWMDHWNQTHDEASLQRIVREAYLSSLGDDALWALGESAWDRGDLASARLYWTQLVPLGDEARAENLPTVLRYPDSDHHRAEVLARLVLCTLLEGERDRAMAELVRFKELAPGATGTLAGREGVLSDLLQAILVESVAWDPSTDVGDIVTFGLTPARDGTLPASLELGASKWSHGLPSSQLSFPERGGVPLDRGPLSYHPVTFGDIVLVNSARSIWAWNLLTGEPAWPGTAEIYPPAREDASGVPNHVCSGVPFHTMTISDGKLYARMGAVTNPAENETRSESLESDLICLDLVRGQGKLVWKIASNELIKEDHKWRFEGAPVVVAGRAYVALSRRRPQLEFAIACLDSATGALLWHRPVVSARGAIEDHHNRISHLLLTHGAGKLFLSTDAGAIVAVNARDGRLEWAITYETVQPRQPIMLSSHLHQGLLPAMFHEGLLFVAPNDCSRLFCIEADSGRVRWQRKQPEPERWRHLLGVVPGGDAGRLIVSGSSLWSIDIAKNTVVFGARANGLGHRTPPSDLGYGRGVIADKVILWPTLEAIKIVDATTGAVIGYKPLHVPGAAEVGGNLTVADGMLLVAQPERLVAYCEYSLLKQRLERELSERLNPTATENPLLASHVEPGRKTRLMTTESLLGQLADIELAQDHLGAAIATLRKAVEGTSAANGDALATARNRSRLVELLRQSSDIALADGDVDSCVAQLLEARQLAVTPDELAVVLVDLANAELPRNPATAAEYWQQILNEDSIRERGGRITSVGAAAEAAITDLIKKQGLDVYAKIEDRAAKEIAELLEAKSLDELTRLLPRYPNSVAARQAWRRLALLDRDAGRINEALLIYARLLKSASADDAQPLADWAETLEAAGYWRPARAAWKQLATGDSARQVVELGGVKLKGSDVGTRRLELPAYRNLEQTERSAARYLDRDWSIPLKSETTRVEELATQVDDRPRATLLIPLGNPPAPSLACILILQSELTAEGSRWECLDSATGQVRWSRLIPELPVWSAYSETHLIVATETQLIAVALEDGRTLWATRLSAEPTSGVPSAKSAAATKREGDARTHGAAVPTQFAIRQPWVLAFEPRMGVTAIDARTGRVAWDFHPPRGRLQRAWSCGESRIAIQTIQPSTMWVIEIAASFRATECPGTFEPWLQGPYIDEDMAITMNVNRRIERLSTVNGRSRWRYQGGMSFAHTDPVLWPAGNHLLLTVDGTTLASINRSTGRADWSVGIADSPLSDPRRQVVANGDAAFAASQGMLKSVSLVNGVSRWERYLDSTADQWGIAVRNGLVATWPLMARGAGARRSRPFVIVCDAATGRILQRVTVSRDEQLLDVLGDDQGFLIRTDRALAAFRAKSETRDVVTVRH